MALENACVQILDRQFVQEREDVETMVFQRKLKNIVTRISLALRECKGPRHFHHHYKHREDDDQILTPVLDDPMETLAHVCHSALSESQNGFTGAVGGVFMADRRILEKALKDFIENYK
jgi:hypothetical protein